MSVEIEKRLSDAGVTLPEVAKPVSNYVPFVISGKTLYISGQLPISPNGDMIKGCLGDNVSIEDGAVAAKYCAIQILAAAKAACEGDLSKIKRLVKLGGFVASKPDFYDHPKVINGASDFLVGILGDAGKHARFAVGVSALPLGVAVEIDAIFELA